jgi:cytochrome c-type biogenesis protein CcmH/NrfF
MTRSRLRRGAVSVLGALVLLGLPSASVAQELDSLPQEQPRPTTVHPEARRAISEIRSPYCPGLMLEVCPSPPAADLRDSIDVLARAGLSADSIVERVIATYGEEWRAVPLREGTGWWAWLMPPAVLLLGLGAIAVLLARRRKVVHGAPASVEVDAEDDDKLRRAMKDLDESEHPEW